MAAHVSDWGDSLNQRRRGGQTEHNDDDVCGGSCVDARQTGQKLEEDMPLARFFNGRILWVEGMASNAYKWTKATRGLMIGLVGADHVKFNAGIPRRYQRMVADEQLDCISVILNPSLIDTRPSGSVSMMSNSAASASGASGLMLQLRYLKRGVDVGSFESRESSNTGGCSRWQTI
jgi:hypothetical protein